MNVEELIELLKAVPPTVRVVVDIKTQDSFGGGLESSDGRQEDVLDVDYDMGTVRIHLDEPEIEDEDEELDIEVTRVAR